MEDKKCSICGCNVGISEYEDYTISEKGNIFCDECAYEYLHTCDCCNQQVEEELSNVFVPFDHYEYDAYELQYWCQKCIKENASLAKNTYVSY